MNERSSSRELTYLNVEGSGGRSTIYPAEVIAANLSFCSWAAVVGDVSNECWH